MIMKKYQKSNNVLFIYSIVIIIIFYFLEKNEFFKYWLFIFNVYTYIIYEGLQVHLLAAGIVYRYMISKRLL